MLKKIFCFFLIVIFSLTVAAIQAAVVEHNVKATVTINPVEGELRVFPSYFEINAAPLAILEKNLTFWQENGNIDINVNLSSNLDFISFSENNFILSPTENKTIKVFINSSNVGTYYGEIYANDLVIPIEVTVTKKYKIDVDIDVSPRKIKAGENISILTKLTKSKLKKPDRDVEGKITVNLEYNVLKQKELITTLTTTMDVVDYSEKTIPILIPANATKGSYTVEVIATHLDKTAKDKDNFLVTITWLRTFFNFFSWFYGGR